MPAYVPKLQDPIKLVCLNLHIFQDNNGLGHYQATEMGRLRQILGWVNQAYASPAPPSHPPSPAAQLITDSRIRFKVHRTEFYKNSSLHNLDNVTSLQAAAVARDASTLNQLNIYIVNSDGVGGAHANPPSANLSTHGWVVYRLPYVDQTQPISAWMTSDFATAVMLRHELGHTLGLSHTYMGGGASAMCDASNPDFLADVFGTNPNTCPHDGSWSANAWGTWPPKVTNNVMGGNNDNMWLSGLQAALMHRALTVQSARRYVATGCRDCGSCVVFTLRGVGHVSQGPGVPLQYNTVDLNESWGWNGQEFVAPVRGIYHFDIGFIKDAYSQGGTEDDVYISLTKNGASLGHAWSGEGSGKRSTGTLAVNALLERGDVVTTIAESESGYRRHIAEYTFAGHLICGCC